MIRNVLSVIVATMLLLGSAACAVGTDPVAESAPMAVSAPLPGSAPTIGATPGDCPVTVPSPALVPPAPYSATAPHGDIWYGTAELWTALPAGEYGPRKSVWWSSAFGGGAVEPEPDIEVTWERLDAERPPISNEGDGTNAHTPEHGWFMIAGIDPDERGCWRVTARYKGAELSYVYWRS